MYKKKAKIHVMRVLHNKLVCTYDDRDFRTATKCTSLEWFCGRYHSLVS